MTVFVGPKRALLGSVKPAWLGASGLWGFTSSPTPQFAHFGRSTNKAGALTSTRNYEAYNLAGTQLFPVNDPVVSAVTGLEGFLSYSNRLGFTADPTQWTFFNTRFSSSAQQPDGSFILTAIVNHTYELTNFSDLYPDGYGLTGDMTIVRRVDVAKTGNTANTVRLGSASDNSSVFVRLSDGVVVRNAGSISVTVTDTGDGYWRIETRRSGTSLSDSMVQSVFGWGNYVGGSSFTNTDGLTVKVRRPFWFRATSLNFSTPLPFVRSITTPATRLADNTTIPDWQAFVERYSLLDGLTIDATANIRLTPSAARRILTIGTANDGFFLEQTTNEFARIDFTTGNRVRMRLIKGTSPAALFTGSQQGVWYDFSDLSTMFQDAAGTVPVTAPGQPVGRVLDKSGNGNHATQSTDTLRPIYQIDANGKPGLLFDGVDDFLVTPSIDFSASDKMLVSAGVRKLSDAAAGVVAELSWSLSGNNGTFFLAAPAAANASFGFASKGTVQKTVSQVIAGNAAPVSKILTGLGDISAPFAGLRINGQLVHSLDTDQGTGNYGNFPLYIGRRGGSSLPFNGFIHQLVVRGGALPSEAELLQLEEWIGIRSGVEVGGLTLESDVVSATGLYDISARFKPGDYALTVSGGVSGATSASAETLPDAIRTEPAYVGRDIAGSLHWNGNIPSLKIGKAG